MEYFVYINDNSKILIGQYGRESWTKSPGTISPLIKGPFWIKSDSESEFVVLLSDKKSENTNYSVNKQS